MNQPLKYDDDDAPAFEEPAFDTSAPLEASTDAFLNGPAASGGIEDEPVPGFDDGFADRPVPRITIEAFYELDVTCRLIEACSEDRRMARAHVETFANGLAAAIERYHDTPTPNLVIVESGMRGRGLFEQLDELANVCDAETKVIVIGAANDIALYRELMKRGVSEYLVPPVSPVQFMRTVASLYADPAEPFYGKTIAFLGAKGGSGSSTVAHNVAWCVAELLKVDTTIIDLDLPFGTAALDFNQDITTGVADALSQPDRVDDVLLDRLLTQCTERLSLFAAPALVDRDYPLDAESCETVIDAVRRTVPVTILDLPHVWASWTRPLVGGADEIIITANPDLACLRNAKQLYDAVNASRPNDAAPKIVLNQVGLPKRPEIPVKDFADALGVDLSLVLPFDAAVFGAAANNGQMISEVAGDSKVAAGFAELAATLLGREVPARKASFFDQLLKRN